MIGENSSLARRYHSYTYDYTGGSRARRKEGLTQLQDDIELAENGGSMHSGVRIFKDVQVEITTETMPDVNQNREGDGYR